MNTKELIDEYLKKHLKVPKGIFEKRIESFIDDNAESMNAPPAFLYGGLFAATSNSIGKTYKVRIRLGFEESANVFLVIVGEPGSKKTPCLREMLIPNYNVQKALYVRYLKFLNLEEEAKKAFLNENGEYKGMSQLITSDITTEGTSYLLSTTASHGLIVFKDEFIGFIYGQNQYKSKGSDKEYWLSAFNGVPIIVNRRGNPPIIVNDPNITLLGGIQPDLLDKITPSLKSGFLGRFIFLFPDKIPLRYSTKVVDPKLRTYYQNTIQNLCKKHVQLSIRQPKKTNILELSIGANEVWEKWIKDHYAEIESGLPMNLDETWHKLTSYLHRIALNLELLKYANSKDFPANISQDSMEKSVRLISFFKAHAIKVQRAIVSNQSRKKIENLIDWMIRYAESKGDGASTEFTPRMLLSAKVGGIKTSDEAKGLLELLASSKKGQFIQKNTTSERGPSIIFKLSSKFFN